MRPPLVAAKPLLDRINVTPIIDVALVLVIILLVTAPMLSAADIDIDLPAARSRGEDEQVSICVTVGPDGQLAVDETRLPERAALVGTVAGRLVDDDDRLVVVRADATLPHSFVREVISDLRAAGVRRVAVAVRQSGGEPQ